MADGNKPMSSSSASNDTVMAAVATIPLVGLIIYFAMKDASDLVKFYAKQSIGLLGISIVVSIVGFVLAIIAGSFSYGYTGFGLSTLFSCVGWLLNLIPLVLWLVLLINALQGKKFRTPVMSDMLDNMFK